MNMPEDLFHSGTHDSPRFFFCKQILGLVKRQKTIIIANSLKKKHIGRVEMGYLSVVTKRTKRLKVAKNWTIQIINECSMFPNSFIVIGSRMSRYTSGTTALESTRGFAPDLQTVKKHFSLSVIYRTYRLLKRSLPHDDTVTSYLAESVEKVM